MRRYIRRYLDQKINSLEETIIVITGANSGIGLSLTKECVYKGAKVIMACRSLKRAESAREQILEEYPKAKLDIMIYDQASFESIKAFATLLMTKYPKINAFVFNAGIFAPKSNVKTQEGYDLTIGTNYLGTFYLTTLLADYFAVQNDFIAVYVGSLVH
ncbi:MAG: SDR family NAD(P)-dependent oxidoreductase, partial [Erysipelotrichaceae bacterium]|nr:SDR family NAD(P)-dependent oxidoreductase [Erysipelotrichaceae bacterium]